MTAQFQNFSVFQNSSVDGLRAMRCPSSTEGTLVRQLSGRCAHTLHLLGVISLIARRSQRAAWQHAAVDTMVCTQSFPDSKVSPAHFFTASSPSPHSPCFVSSAFVHQCGVWWSGSNFLSAPPESWARQGGWILHIRFQGSTLGTVLSAI